MHDCVARLRSPGTRNLEEIRLSASVKTEQSRRGAMGCHDASWSGRYGETLVPRHRGASNDQDPALRLGQEPLVEKPPHSSFRTSMLSGLLSCEDAVLRSRELGHGA